MGSSWTSGFQDEWPCQLFKGSVVSIDNNGFMPHSLGGIGFADIGVSKDEGGFGLVICQWK